MKRAAEITIILSTLAAIVSTFFLYRENTFSPKLTASVIDSEESMTQESADVEETTITQSTTTPVTSTEGAAEETTNEASSSLVENNIIIEKLPITAEEVATLTTQIHSLTNLSRSQNNLPKYTLDVSLSAVAKQRSEEMVRENYFSHTSPSGCDVSCQIKKSGYQTMSWGENLALSNSYHLYTLPELAQTFTSNWLKSTTHRDNLLSKKFTHHGIGIASEGEQIVITVVFATP